MRKTMLFVSVAALAIFTFGSLTELRRTNLRLLARTSGEVLKRVGGRAEHAEESVEHMIRPLV